MLARLRPLALAGLILVLAAPAPSQAPAKRPLKHTDYAGWRSIAAPALSPDGTLVLYAVAPQEGDGEFVARNLSTGKEHRHPRGSRAIVRITPGARAGRGAGRGPSEHLFSADGKMALFPIYPTAAD